MINLVRAIKKRRISIAEKQDVDVEQQELEANPFGHLVENASVALKNIITPKKRKLTHHHNHNHNSHHNRTTPRSAQATQHRTTVLNSEFAYQQNLTGWSELGTGPALKLTTAVGCTTPLKSHAQKENSGGGGYFATPPSRTPSKTPSKSGGAPTGGFQTPNSSVKKLGFLASIIRSAQKNHASTPMSDISDSKIDTYHSPVNSPPRVTSPLQTLHCSPSSMVSSVASLTRPRVMLGVALSPTTSNGGGTPQSAAAARMSVMMSRRRSQYHQYHSPRSSICAKRLNFEDSSNRNKNDDDDNAEIVTEEDEYDFMSNEEKIAQVFTLVRSPFEMRRKSLLSVSSPGKGLNATPYDNEQLPPRQQQAQSQGICKKRTMEDRSPVKGASATRSMLQTKKAPAKQYAYCLRVFIGGAQDLINTNVGFKRNPDPYVTLQIGQCRQTTPHVVGTRFPSFNQSFSFMVQSTRRPPSMKDDGNDEAETMDHTDPSLVIKVFDHDNIFEHAFMGKATVQLCELLEECQKTKEGRSEVKTAELKLSGDGIDKGTIQVVYDMSQGANFKL